ncbi:MAG: hypothetical protein HC817_10560 [Saprospiraceae bacterium]|nr:hypothetical protein [Saprospiraceae bacterium]
MKFLQSNILQRLGSEYITTNARREQLYCINPNGVLFVQKSAKDRKSDGKTDSDNIHFPS